MSIKQKILHLRGNFNDNVQQSNPVVDDRFKNVSDKLIDGEIAINKNGLPKLYTKNDNGIIQKFISEQDTNQRLAEKFEKSINNFRPSHSAMQSPFLFLHDNMYFSLKSRSIKAFGIYDVTLLDGDYIFVEMDNIEYNSETEQAAIREKLGSLGQTLFETVTYRSKHFVAIENSIISNRLDSYTAIILWNTHGVNHFLSNLIDGINHFGEMLNVSRTLKFNAHKNNAIVNCDNVYYDGEQFTYWKESVSSMNMERFFHLINDSFIVYWRVCPGNNRNIKNRHYKWRRFLKKRNGGAKYYFKYQDTKQIFISLEYFENYLKKRVCGNGRRIGTNSYNRGMIGIFNDVRYIDFAIFYAKRPGRPYGKGLVYRLSAKPVLKYDTEWNFTYATEYVMDGYLTLVRTIDKNDVNKGIF